MKKIISIDRIEGEIVVAEAENGEMLDLSKNDFADPAVATYCYYLGEDGRWHKDEDETTARKKRNIELLKSLIQKD